MAHDFDATITLNDHHLAAAGLTGRHAEAVEAVRGPSSGWTGHTGSGLPRSPILLNCPNGSSCIRGAGASRPTRRNGGNCGTGSRPRRPPRSLLPGRRSDGGYRWLSWAPSRTPQLTPGRRATTTCCCSPRHCFVAFSTQTPGFSRSRSSCKEAHGLLHLSHHTARPGESGRCAGSGCLIDDFLAAGARATAVAQPIRVLPDQTKHAGRDRRKCTRRRDLRPKKGKGDPPTPGGSLSYSASAARATPEALKEQAFRNYGLQNPHDRGRSYEVDHRVPLSLGGRDEIDNLWPESRTAVGFNAWIKDRLEYRLYTLVCHPRRGDPIVTLKAWAQDAFLGDWTKAYAA